MATITKTAFVADLDETHRISRQAAQEAVNAVVATLMQTLIDGHGIAPLGETLRSQLTVLFNSKSPAISNGRSDSRNDLVRKNDKNFLNTKIATLNLRLF